MANNNTERYRTENLNKEFEQYEDASQMHEDMLTHLGGTGGPEELTVRNFIGVIKNVTKAKCTLETTLFPRGALEYYAKRNLGETMNIDETKAFKSIERDDEQSDYSSGIQIKIKNIVDCLKAHPYSKRAVLPLPFSDENSTSVDYKKRDQAKCLREVYFYFEDPDTATTLSCTAMLRYEEYRLFPKTIYFLGRLMEHVATKIGSSCIPGDLTYVVTNLVKGELEMIERIKSQMEVLELAIYDDKKKTKEGHLFMKMNDCSKVSGVSKELLSRIIEKGEKDKVFEVEEKNGIQKVILVDTDK